MTLECRCMNVHITAVTLRYIPRKSASTREIIFGPILPNKLVFSLLFRVHATSHCNGEREKEREREREREGLLFQCGVTSKGWDLTRGWLYSTHHPLPT